MNVIIVPAKIQKRIHKYNLKTGKSYDSRFNLRYKQYLFDILYFDNRKNFFKLDSKTQLVQTAVEIYLSVNRNVSRTV